MDSQLWRYHSQRLQSGDATAIWVQILEARHPQKKRLGFAPISAQAEPAMLQSKLFVEQLIHELKEKSEKGYATHMDDKGVNNQFQLTTEQAQPLFDDVEHTISELTDLVSVIPRYQKVFSEKLTLPQPILPATEREAQSLKLGMVFLEMAGWNDCKYARIFIDKGFPINFQHPRTRKTLLHMAAHWNGASDLANMLLDNKRINCVLTDTKDQTAFDIAYRHNRDHDLTLRLFNETQVQENKEGINLDYPYGTIEEPKF